MNNYWFELVADLGRSDSNCDGPNYPGSNIREQSAGVRVNEIVGGGGEQDVNQMKLVPVRKHTNYPRRMDGGPVTNGGEGRLANESNRTACGRCLNWEPGLKAVACCGKL